MFRLMVAVTLIAILLGLAVTFGGFVEVVFVSLVWCILPTPLVVFAIFGHRDLRSFSLGALIPWLVLMFARIPLNSVIGATIWLLAMGGICGVLAVATRRWLESNSSGL